MPRLLADLTPLRVSPHYRRMWTGLSLANIGNQLGTVAIGLQVYDLTRSSFSVGLVGLFGLVPLIVLGLYGGSLVDAYDRRTVAAVSSAGLGLVALGLVAQAWLRVDSVWLLYALVAVQWAFFAVNNPARSAILPRLLPRELLPAANALQTLAWTVGFALGPLLGGFVVSHSGYAAAYGIEAVAMVIGVATLLRLPKLPPEGEVRRAGVRSVIEGLRFLGTRPNVRATFVIDLCAMVFAQPRALFPVAGAVLLGGGATTVGLLASAAALGSFLASAFSGSLGEVRRQGLITCWAVVGWALSITLFGVVLAVAPEPAAGEVSPWLWAACLTLALAGASDTVSAVFRQTILQTATPDAMRGRLQGVFIVVVAGGPRLGDLVAGAAADLVSAPFAQIAGGLLCVAAVAVLARAQPAFPRYDAHHPEP